MEHQQHQRAEQQRALGAADDPGGAQRQEHQRGDEQRRGVAGKRTRLVVHGLHQGGEPQHQQDVGNVAAEDVAGGDFRHADAHRLHGNHHFRQRGGEADDDDAHHQRRKMQPAAERHRAPHHGLAAGEQQGEAGSDHQDEREHEGIVSPLLFGMEAAGPHRMAAAWPL